MLLMPPLLFYIRLLEMLLTQPLRGMSLSKPLFVVLLKEQVFVKEQAVAIRHAGALENAMSTKQDVAKELVFFRKSGAW
jgi:hypothetical protein